MTKTPNSQSRKKASRQSKPVGPTWWCPIQPGTTPGGLADRYAAKGGQLYVPVDATEDWCIRGAPKYGFARPLDGGFYAFSRAARRLGLATHVWLLRLDGVEAEVVAGPFSLRVPDSAIIKALRQNDDPETVYFHVNLEGSRLSVGHFSGGTMDEFRRRAQNSAT